MTMEYEDVVRSINQAYWQTLLENDATARRNAAALAQRYGFQPNAADTMIEEFSRQPLQAWLAHQAGLDATEESGAPYSHTGGQPLAQSSGA